jgi:hypothetical protein
VIVKGRSKTAKSRAEHHLLHARLQRLLHLRIGSKPVAAVGRNGQPPGAALFHQVGEFPGAYGQGVVIGNAQPELQLGGMRNRGQQRCQRQAHGSNSGFHGFSPG